MLLTGGAGYIGSHVAMDLVREGYEVIILDDLSRGLQRRSWVASWFEVTLAIWTGSAPCWITIG